MLDGESAPGQRRRACPAPGWTQQPQADPRLSGPQPPDTMSRDDSGQLTLRKRALDEEFEGMADHGRGQQRGA